MAMWVTIISFWNFLDSLEMGFFSESFTNHFGTRIRKFCNFENFGSDFDEC